MPRHRPRSRRQRLRIAQRHRWYLPSLSACKSASGMFRSLASRSTGPRTPPLTGVAGTERPRGDDRACADAAEIEIVYAGRQRNGWRQANAGRRRGSGNIGGGSRRSSRRSGSRRGSARSGSRRSTGSGSLADSFHTGQLDVDDAIWARDHDLGSCDDEADDEQPMDIPTDEEDFGTGSSTRYPVSPNV
jgi:hypothetical protein